MNEKASATKKVWLVAVVWVLVGFLLGFIVGSSDLLSLKNDPSSISASDETTVTPAVNEKYIGKWKKANVNEENIITINPDGTVTEDRYWYEDKSSTMTGVVKGDSISYTKLVQYTPDANGAPAVSQEGDVTFFYNLELSEEDVLFLVGANGYKNSYFRVSE